ncbi:hypothetical protein M378DRAFT_167169 [Amanita muscaria Koide BX008]|uniref:Uncharacterized protein n=1 Tax=Amanita muscaria (strain Koide BX008) TaxID=946122 RepID=A0A0C2T3V3_AMAMK|nr:hypothetical protein M378DRAFT_167169 [Amanita muscaria Koide BX008]
MYGAERGKKRRAAENCFSTVRQITNALRDAHGLVDLRITLRVWHSEDSKEKLDVAIKSGHFQLHTLYSDSFQDLEGIIDNQKHLRLFGIDYNPRAERYFNVSKLIKNLCHSQIDSKRKLPYIFMFSIGGYSGDISELTLFPELCRPGHAFTLCEAIATSLRTDCYNFIRTDCNFIIHIFDFTHAEAATICKLIEGMAQHLFAGCEHFTMRVQTRAVQGTALKPWRIPGFLTSISQFRQLQYLEFDVPGDKSVLHCAAIDLRSFLLEELSFAYPTLEVVTVRNSVKRARLKSPCWEIVTENCAYSYNR